jgi:hypothetical protein
MENLLEPDMFFYKAVFVGIKLQYHDSNLPDNSNKCLYTLSIFWPTSKNRKELEAVMRYTYEQGLVKEHGRFEEMFHPNTFDLQG